MRHGDRGCLCLETRTELNQDETRFVVERPRIRIDHGCSSVWKPRFGFPARIREKIGKGATMGVRTKSLERDFWSLPAI